jgi:hypothetical protein
MKPRAAAAVLVLMVAPAVRGDDRREVAVRVEVAAPTFRRELVPPGQASSPGLDGAERDAAEQIAAHLNKPPTFLRFGPNGTAATLTLRVVAKAPATATTALKEIGIIADVAGNDIARGDPAYFTLRRQDDIRAAPATPKELASEIAGAVAMNDDALTRDVLSRVPIAQTSAIWKDPWGWVIPFTPRDICIDTGSRFKIANTFRQGSGPRSVEFPAEMQGEFDPEGTTAPVDLRHRIFVVALEHPDLAQLKQASAPSVKAVRVTQYLRLTDACGRQLDPSEAFR